MSWTLWVNRAAVDPDLKGEDRKILLGIMGMCMKDWQEKANGEIHKCYFIQREFAKILGIGPRQVTRSLAKLDEKRYIKRIYKKRSFLGVEMVEPSDCEQGVTNMLV